jgi:hypothetical protein
MIKKDSPVGVLPTQEDQYFMGRPTGSPNKEKSVQDWEQYEKEKKELALHFGSERPHNRDEDPNDESIQQELHREYLSAHRKLTKHLNV